MKIFRIVFRSLCSLFSSFFLSSRFIKIAFALFAARVPFVLGSVSKHVSRAFTGFRALPRACRGTIVTKRTQRGGKYWNIGLDENGSGKWRGRFEISWVQHAFASLDDLFVGVTLIIRSYRCRNLSKCWYSLNFVSQLTSRIKSHRF